MCTGEFRRFHHRKPGKNRASHQGADCSDLHHHACVLCQGSPVLLQAGLIPRGARNRQSAIRRTGVMEAGTAAFSNPIKNMRDEFPPLIPHSDAFTSAENQTSARGKEKFPPSHPPHSRRFARSHWRHTGDHRNIGCQSSCQGTKSSKSQHPPND
jgi:hypothetical protein